MPKRKAGMLQGGLRFNHPEYGECEVLAGGEWTFDADGRATKEPHVYFHSVAVNVPDGVRDNHLTWDETKGIAHDLSSKVRALIARPVPKLSSNHAGTPASRLAGFKKHPVFHDDELLPFLSDDPTGFAAVLRSASPDAYKLACAAAKRFNKDMKRDGGAAAAAVRVTIRSLVTAVAMLADCARSSLARSRPKAADENDAAGYARTLDVTLDENGARYLETLLSLCGFVEGEGNAWTPACAGATHRFVGAHAHPTGVNPLRRAWAFPAGEVRAWRGDGRRGVRSGRARARPDRARRHGHAACMDAAGHDRERVDREEGRAPASARPHHQRIRARFCCEQNYCRRGGGATYHRRRRPHRIRVEWVGALQLSRGYPAAVLQAPCGAGD